MATAGEPWYPVRIAAELLGLTTDALRKRIAADKWPGATRDEAASGLQLHAAQVERERAALLRKLNAVDGRLRAADPENNVAVLRADLARLQGAVDGLLVSLSGHQEAERGYLDALKQHLLPQKPPP